MVAVVISVIAIQYFFNLEYTNLLNQVKNTLTNFSVEKEEAVSQFLADAGGNLEFRQNQELVDTIYITSDGNELMMDDLRNLLYVEQQETLRLNAYLVNESGALLTAQKEFDVSSDRTTAKIVRNDLINRCLFDDLNQENFYTGIDEGNRAVYGTYMKVMNDLPLCLFSETEKVTNIDVPAQQILKRDIFLGIIFVLVITFLSGFLSSFRSRFSMEEMLLFVLCGATGVSYVFVVSLVTRGVNYFSLESHFLEWAMAILAFFLLIVMMPIKISKYLRVGGLFLGIYFLLFIFFEEYRQAYALSSEVRNLILVLLRFFSITGFLYLFFGFKKNLKL